MEGNVINENKLQIYKYKSEVYIIDAGTKEPIKVNPENVQAFVVENDYVNNFFPILKLNLAVSHDTMFKVKNNKEKIKIRVITKKFTNNINSKNNFDDKNYSYTLVFDKIFQPFNINITPLTKNRIDLLKQGNQVTDAEEILEIYLFNLDHLNMNKSIINDVITNCYIQDVLGYIFNYVKLENILMQLPDNKTYYTSDIIIPPLNFRNTIELLQNVYGIYKKGLRQYLDFDIYYLLNEDFNSEMPQKINDFETVFINIGETENNKSFNVGSYKDNKQKCYIVNLPNNIEFSTESEFSKEIDGNIYEIFNYNNILNSVKYNNGKFQFDSGSLEYKLNIKGYEDGRNKTKFLYNPNDNDYLNETIVHNKEKSDVILNFEVDNTNLDIFKPNKKYIVNFEDYSIGLKYNGTYELNGLVYGFDSGDLYCILELLKIL